MLYTCCIAAPDMPLPPAASLQELLGEPVLEVTMNPGDVMYLPRGTPHQAEAQVGSYTCRTHAVHVLS